MTSQSDSRDTAVVDLDDYTIPHTPLGPIPPKLRELMERERELMRRYGKLPPAPPTPPPADQPPEPPPPAT